MTDINLTLKGQEIGGFLDAIKDPLSGFLLAIGLVAAILGLIWAVILVIGDSVRGLSSRFMGHRK